MHTKYYLNQEIKEEIEKKGFSIYNYISLKELLFTVNKDFLSIVNHQYFTIIYLLLMMTIMFPLSFVVMLQIKNPFTILISILVYAVFIYSLIYVYLIYKLLFRTYKFSKITNILYTKKGLIIDNKIFHYEEDSKLKNLLLDYEKLFDEYLSKPSKLSENINIFKKNISDNITKDSEGKKDYFSYGLIFIFYYLGIILGFFFFFIFFFFISLYFKINKSVELKIKDNMTIIDNKIKKLDEIYHLLNNQISTFKDGEISNLSKKIDKNMNKFYENINTVLTQKNLLTKIIEQSIYKDFIDFEYLAFYIKTQFNKPLTDVIKLMSDYKSKVDNQINEIENYLKNSNEKENYQVEQKLINLQTIQKNISIYLNKLKMSLQ
ncbi:hypothetical protein [Aliarcobacter vitoriensis]|uniref:Uncharacterized protein n=1 Tax=Aliarcobacter vitoriensis TaxID=2011099 RepID=A0A366MSS9_9BACT|nr:hypothetical protein [Aliarcobacter vitoriensis]RBQ28644.1 hypothetical protein CRU91_08090 [Aliarcobacter vitoriensis]